MSERTTSESVVNTTVATPEQTAPEQPPTPEQVVNDEAAQAAARADEEKAAARKAANATLDKASKAVQKAEDAYGSGYLAAGKLGDQYLHQRMAVGDKREASVSTLEGELNKWSSHP